MAKRDTMHNTLYVIQTIMTQFIVKHTVSIIDVALKQNRSMTLTAKHVLGVFRYDNSITYYKLQLFTDEYRRLGNQLTVNVARSRSRIWTPS